MDAHDSQLRFLSASHVQTPAGNLNDSVIVSEGNRQLGKLDGIVIDPIARRVRYFVIKSQRWLRHHRYLMEATPLRFETEKTLRLVGEFRDLDQLPEIRPDTFSPYSEQDLLAALFPSRAA
jgi:hypothetical protein